MSNSKNKNSSVLFLMILFAFAFCFLVAFIITLYYGNRSITDLETEIEREYLKLDERIAENQQEIEELRIDLEVEKIALEELRFSLEQEILALEEELLDIEEQQLISEEEILAVNENLAFLEIRLAEIEIALAQNGFKIMDNFSFIPQGEFIMGTNDGPYLSWGPEHPVYLNSFWMQNFEITNREFATFLNVFGNQQSPDGDTWLKEDGKNLQIYFNDGRWHVENGFENYPVVQVNWYGATAYCDYIGGRLPTEAEWEKAARGGLENANYPWGNQSSVCTAGASNGAQSDKCDGGIRPVGSFAPNGYGVYDMSGNLWEWVSDWYEENYYSVSPYENPLGPNYGERRSCRGGAWDSWYLEVATRNFCGPQAHADYLGFRCVLDAE